MTAFLAGIVEAVLAWLAGKLGLMAEKEMNREDIKADAQKSVEPLQNATTAKEIDDATDKALDGF